MPDFDTLTRLVNKAITDHAASSAKVEALHEAMGEIKGKIQVALDGIGGTQKDIVLALERLNTNLEDHKVIHQRITDLKSAHEEQRERIDSVEHSCSKEKSEETAAKVVHIEKIMQVHGIYQLRDGEQGHGVLIASHARFIAVFTGKVGAALLAMIILGTILDFTCHYDTLKRITTIFTG
jgi:hypothetical protein